MTVPFLHAKRNRRAAYSNVQLYLYRLICYMLLLSVKAATRQHDKNIEEEDEEEQVEVASLPIFAGSHGVCVCLCVCVSVSVYVCVRVPVFDQRMCKEGERVPC